MGFRPFSRYHRLLWITVLVLLASGTLLLAACGSASSTSTSTPTATTAQTPTPTATATPGSTPTPTTPSGGNTAQVSIVNSGGFAFSPATLTIAKGTTVIWTNTTGTPHTVTSDNGAFPGINNVSPSQTIQLTFNTAGTFTYHCAIHTYMTATIIVTA